MILSYNGRKEDISEANELIKDSLDLLRELKDIQPQKPNERVIFGDLKKNPSLINLGTKKQNTKKSTRNI